MPRELGHVVSGGERDDVRLADGMPRDLGHVLSDGTRDVGRHADGRSLDMGRVVSVEIGDTDLVPRDCRHAVSAGEDGA